MGPGKVGSNLGIKAMKNSGKFQQMKERKSAMRYKEEGKIGWILLWLVGVPIPILLVLYLLRGCT
jgi:hypothetical protein